MLTKQTKKVPVEDKTPSEYAREISRQFCGVKVRKNEDGETILIPPKNSEKNNWHIKPEPLLEAVQRGKYVYIARQNCGTDEIVVDIDTGNEETDKWIRYCTGHPEEYLLFQTVIDSEDSKHKKGEHWTGHVIFRGGSHRTMHLDKKNLHTYKIDILGNINEQGEPTSCLWNIKRNKYIEDSDIINLNAKIAALNPTPNWKDKILEFVDITEFKPQPTSNKSNASEKHIGSGATHNGANNPDHELDQNNSNRRAAALANAIDAINRGEDGVKHPSTLKWKTNLLNYLIPESSVEKFLKQNIVPEHLGKTISHYNSHAPVEYIQNEFDDSQKKYRYLADDPVLINALKSNKNLFIEAPAGAGKSYAVVQALGNNNVLYRTTRKTLVDQRWDTVQGLVQKPLKETYPYCRVLVLDEFHSALAFDKTTPNQVVGEWIFTNIVPEQDKIRLIFMTATLDENVREFIKTFNGLVKPENEIKLIDCYKTIAYREAKVEVKFASVGGCGTWAYPILTAHVNGTCDFVYRNKREDIDAAYEYFNEKGMKVGRMYNADSDMKKHGKGYLNPETYKTIVEADSTDYDMIILTSMGELGNNCNIKNLGKIYVIAHPEQFDGNSVYQFISRFREQDKEINIFVKYMNWDVSKNKPYTSHDTIRGAVMLMPYAKIEGDYIQYRNEYHTQKNLFFELLNFGNYINKVFNNVSFCKEVKNYKVDSTLKLETQSVRLFDIYTDFYINDTGTKVAYVVRSLLVPHYYLPISEEDCTAYLTAQFCSAFDPDGYVSDDTYIPPVYAYDMCEEDCDAYYTAQYDYEMEAQYLSSNEELKRAQSFSLFLFMTEKAERLISSKTDNTTKQEVKIVEKEIHDDDFLAKASPVDSVTVRPYYEFLVDKGATKNTFIGRKNYPIRYFIINEAVTPETREYIVQNANKMVPMRELFANFHQKIYYNPYYDDYDRYFFLKINEIKKMMIHYITSTRDCPDGFVYLLRFSKDKINELLNMPFQVERKVERKDRGKRRKEADEILSDSQKLSDTEMRTKYGKDWKRGLKRAQKRTQ
jgi:hypothetical protein